MIKNITIGSDPEYIVYDPIKEICVPAIGYTLGSKEIPEPIGNDFFIQIDNALLEGNIPPAKSFLEFAFNMEFLTGYMINLASMYENQIIFKDSGDYDIDELQADKETLLFGCDPFNNAWDPNRSFVAPDLGAESYRTCGFHIHIGYSLVTNKISKEEMDIFLTKAFDLFVVLPSYLINLDPRRTGAYGGLGQYRAKSYGVECRSLGGFFVEPSRIKWVWDSVQSAIEFCKSEKNLDTLNTIKKLERLDSKEYIEEYLNIVKHPSLVK